MANVKKCDICKSYYDDNKHMEFKIDTDPTGKDFYSQKLTAVITVTKDVCNKCLKKNLKNSYALTDIGQ